MSDDVMFPEIPHELKVETTQTSDHEEAIIFTDQDDADDAQVTGRWFASTVWIDRLGKVR